MSFPAHAYFEDRLAAAACMASRVLRHPFLTPSTPDASSFWSGAPLRQRAAAKAAAIAAAAEEVRPPQFEVEAAERAAKRVSRKMRREWAPGPTGVVIPPSSLGFKYPSFEEKRDAAGEKAFQALKSGVEIPQWQVEAAESWFRRQLQRQAAIAAAKRRGRKPLFAYIAGVRVPRIGNNWFAYAKKREETPQDWVRRVRGLKRAIGLGKRMRAHDHNLDLPEWEQIMLLSKRTGQHRNRFAPISGRAYYAGCSDPLVESGEEFVFRRTWAKETKPKQFGPKTNFGFERVQSCLARKAVRYALQQEWREARSLRREKMSRVLVRLENHRVVALKVQLENLALRWAKENRETFFSSLSQRPCCAPEGQMADVGEDAQGDTSAKTDKKSNVEIQQQAAPSIGSVLPGGKVKNAYDSLSAAESKIDDKTFHDRWYTIKQLTWNNSLSRGMEILRMSIPKDIFEDPKFKQSPNYTAMSRHMYWKGDIEFKIICNTNCRQYGQIQFSFYYGSDHDLFYRDLRTNIYTASQRLHALMTANQSNEVILKVPFEYIFPIMAINKVSGTGTKHLGELLGLILVPLTAAQGCTNSASVKVLVRFSENKFSGMVGNTIAEAQMFGLASIIAVKSLLDKNRDSPSMTSPGMPVIPVNTSSWCYGTGQSQYNNILRLNPNEVLPYAEGRIPNLDEMTIDNIKQKFGLIGFKEWKADNNAGDFLGAFDATPLREISSYYSFKFMNTDVYVPPPVGVLSSLFSYWRGSLELRIDVVGATEISGSLLVAYVPRYLTADAQKLTMEDLFSCSHSIFDIHENRQLSFKIPYVASHMFWPRRRTLSTEYPIYEAPGAVFIYCYNKLIMNCTIPQECHLVFYLRGGEDFEVSVPASPSVGLGFHPIVYIPQEVNKRVIPIEGYTPCYAGSWRYAIVTAADQADYLALTKKALKTDAYNYIPVVRYGTTTDHVTLFRSVHFKIKPFENYLCKIETTVNGYVEWTFGDVSSRYQAKYLLISGDNDYTYGYPLPDARDIWLTTIKLAATLGHRVSTSVLWLAMINQRFNQDYNKNNLIAQDTPWWQPIDFYCSVVFPENPEAEAGDEGSSVSAPVAAPQDSAQSSVSKLIFGEQFLDLKDLCRRFQLYASRSIKIDKLLSVSDWRTIIIRFPVVPQGLSLDVGSRAAINEYWNRTRDGPIPIIASGFRFFTGGIRYRICVNVRSSESIHPKELRGKIFVQHRPNIISTAKRVIVQAGSSLGTEDIELPGYASYHQFEDLNNVLSIEVPFYQPSLRTYLQRTGTTDLAQRFSDLGELAVGVTVFSNDQIRFDYDIYYSLADDARFSVFVGFPPVIDIAHIPPLEPTSSRFLNNELAVKEEEVSWCDRYEKMGSVAAKKERTRLLEIAHEQGVDFSKMPFLDPKTKEEEIVNLCWIQKRIVIEGEMFSLFSSKTAETIDKVNDIADKIDPKSIDEIKATASNMKSITENLKDFIGGSIPSLETIQNKFQKWVSLIINAVTNLCHCLINFNIKTVIVAIASFFCQLKVMSFSLVSMITEKLGQMFSWLCRSPTQPIQGSIEGQMADSSEKEEDSILCSYVSTLIAGVAAIFGFVPKFCKARTGELGDLVMKGLKNFALTANALFTFVKNNLIAIRRIGEWLFSDHPSIRKLGFLKKHEDIHEWAEAVLEYTDPRKENEVFTSVRKASQAYVLAAQASILHVKLLELELNHAQVQVIQNLIKKINDLKERLTKAHMAPPVRFEPFVYELTGKTGIGKSELLKSLPYDLFNFMNLKHEGELIYHRALGNAYWNNLRNQPVCTIDEKFPIDSPEFLGVQLAELFQLKSSCVFNPPMADIPDKNIRYNPVIVQYGSNCPFPDLPGVRDKTAVYRRRDVLVEVKIRQDLAVNHGADAKFAKLKDLGLAKEGDFSHLEFRIHTDPTNGSGASDQWGPVLSYVEFKSLLCRKFATFFCTEERKFRREIERMSCVLPPEGEESSLKKLFDYKWLDSVERVHPNFEERIARFRERSFAISIDNPISKKKLQYMHNIECAFYEYVLGDYDRVRQLKIEFAQKHPELIPPPPCEKPHVVCIVDVAEDVLAHQKILAGQVDALTARLQATIIDDAERARLQDQLMRTRMDLENTGYVSADIRKDMRGRIEAQAGDGEEIVCFHQMLPVAFSYYSTKTVWNCAKEQFEISLPSSECMSSFCINMMVMPPEDKWENFYKHFSNNPIGTALNEEDQVRTIHIPWKACKSPNCIAADEDKRNKFLKENYIKNNPELVSRLVNANKAEDFIPSEYFKQYRTKAKEIDEHKETAKKLPESLGFFAKIKEFFYDFSWTKWLQKISLCIAVFGFVGGLVGLWYWSKADSPEQFWDASCVTEQYLKTGVLGTAAATSCMMVEDNKKLNKELIKIASGEGHVSGDFKVLKSSSGHRKAPAVKTVLAIKGEAGSSIMQQDVVINKLYRNSFFIDFASDNVPRNPGRCLGICGKYAIIVDHFWSVWQNVAKKTGEREMIFIPCIDGRPSAIIFNLDEVKYQPIKDSSLGLLKLPKRIPNFKDIRSMFCKRNDHKNLNRIGSVAEFGLSRERIRMDITNVKFTEYSDVLNVDPSGLWDSFKIFHAYEYEGFSGKGRCGSVLLAHGTQNPIVGMHVAGYPQTNWGLSEAIYSEMFENLISAPEPVSPQGESLTSRWFVDAQVIGIGKVGDKFAHREKGKSRIVPSEVQLKDKGKDFKIFTEPAVLSNHDARLPPDEQFSPMIEGCKHHGNPLQPFAQEDIAYAISDLRDLILVNCKPQRQNVGRLSIDEAIGGIDGKPGYEHIEFSTSEGFPFVGFRPKGASNKKWLFNFDEENHYSGCSEMLENILKLKWLQRLQNKIPATVFTDCLKDCTVAKEKVLQPGKTRVFSMAPVDFTIQERQCTLDFVVAYMTGRLDLEHMIGCNPDSIEWTLMSRRLLTKGSAILTGDYSKYGDNLPFEFIEGAFSIIADWYRANGCSDEELFQQLKIFPYEIGNSLHLMFDHIYQVVCGQPSGNSLTVIINSIANSLYLRVAWINIMKNSAFNSLADLAKHVQIYSYGDDLICSLSDEIKDLFNAQSLFLFFGSHGLKFTNADKSGTIIPYAPLSEAEFLKRGFVEHPTRRVPRVMLAPLGISSIEDTINWVWEESFDRSNPESLTFREMCLQVCHDSLRNAFSRGPEYYNSWFQKLKEFWFKQKVNFTADRWEHMDYKIFDLNMDLSPFHKW